MLCYDDPRRWESFIAEGETDNGCCGGVSVPRRNGRGTNVEWDGRGMGVEWAWNGRDGCEVEVKS